MKALEHTPVRLHLVQKTNYTVLFVASVIFFAAAGFIFLNPDAADGQVALISVVVAIGTAVGGFLGLRASASSEVIFDKATGTVTVHWHRNGATETNTRNLSDITSVYRKSFMKKGKVVIGFHTGPNLGLTRDYYQSSQYWTMRKIAKWMAAAGSEIEIGRPRTA